MKILALLLLAGCGGATPQAEEPTPEERPRLAIAIRFEEASEAADGAPRTALVLARVYPDRDAETAPIGVVPGACHHVRPEDDMLLRVECSWGPQESQAWVSRQRDELVVTLVDGSQSQRLPREALRVTVPEGADVETIQPQTMPLE